MLDIAVAEYISRNPNAVAINIACGLDTRCYRMEGKISRWYNLDLLKTMAVRERLLMENGAISQIAKSATGFAFLIKFI